MSASHFLGIAIFGMVGTVALYVITGPEAGPIMTCDPATQLQKGMAPAQVRELCGEPKSSDETEVDWYPLRGDTRDNKESRRDYAWRYGSVMSRTRNVNLYFRRGVLDSVQIYGDYK